MKGLPPVIKNNDEELDNIRADFALVSRLHHPYIAAALHLQLAREVHYAGEDVRQKLHKGKQRSVAVLRELEACGLIRRRKRGQGRPAVITLNYPDDVRFVERKGEAHDL